MGKSKADLQASQQAQLQAQQQAAFLRFCKPSNVTQAGTLATANPGGGSLAVITWTGNNGDIPEVPKWARAIDLYVTLPVSLTLGATTGAATLSPFAPWSAFSTSWGIAGINQWESLELTAHYLETITRTRGYDPSHPGLGLPIGPSASLWLSDDRGQWSMAGLTPGQVVTNVTGAPVTTNYTFKFKIRMWLQNYRRQGYGLIPLGDPQNRPKLKVILNPLVGNNPEANLFVTPVLATCVTNGVTQVTAVYRCLDVPLLPQGLSVPPYPTVAMVKQIMSDTTAVGLAGAFIGRKLDVKMQYERLIHVTVNNQAPIDPDYFAMWATGQQQSALETFDAGDGSINALPDDYQRRYHRYLPQGVLLNDMFAPAFPDFPDASPEVLQMTPDLQLAAQVGLPVTPSAISMFRIPAGTVLNVAYARNYSYGMVPAPF